MTKYQEYSKSYLRWPKAGEPPYDPREAEQRDLVYVLGNTLGVFAIVSGGIALLVSLIPVVGVAALPLAFGGIMWGAIGAIMLVIGRRGSVVLPAIGVAAAVAALVVVIVVQVVVVGWLFSGSSSTPTQRDFLRSLDY